MTELDCMSPLFGKYIDYCTVVFEPSNDNTYAAAFKKGNEATADKLTKVLVKLYADGTIKKNIEKYYGADKQMADIIWKTIDEDWLLK